MTTVCPAGHTRVVGAKRGRCAVCHRESVRAWRVAHLDEARARDRARYADPSKGRRNASKVGSQRWRERHPDQSRAVSLSNRHAHLDRVRAASREYQRKHPERMAESSRRRRARVMGALREPVTGAMLAALLRSQGNACGYCQTPLGEDKHLDHRTPLVRGGAHAIGNLCWSCPPCNRRKGRRTAEEFIALRGSALECVA